MRKMWGVFSGDGEYEDRGLDMVCETKELAQKIVNRYNLGKQDYDYDLLSAQEINIIEETDNIEPVPFMVMFGLISQSGEWMDTSEAVVHSYPWESRHAYRSTVRDLTRSVYASGTDIEMVRKVYDEKKAEIIASHVHDKSS